MVPGVHKSASVRSPSGAPKSDNAANTFSALSDFRPDPHVEILSRAHVTIRSQRVRATKDLDVWIRPESDNAEKVLAASSDFGAPLGDLTLADLCTPGTIFQIGMPPLRIDENYQRSMESSSAGLGLIIRDVVWPGACFRHFSTSLES